MKDNRDKHIKWYGYFLIFGSVLLFAYFYWDVSREMRRLGAEKYIWDILEAPAINLISTMILGAFLLPLSCSIHVGKMWPGLVWVVLTLVLIAEEIYALSQKFHFIFVIKITVLSYLAFEAIKFCRPQREEAIDSTPPTV